MSLVDEFEKMTPEQLAVEREAIAAERAALRGPQEDILLGAPLEVAAPAAEETPEPEVSDWAYGTTEYGGLTLEVRKPSEGALVALAMAGSPGIDNRVQVSIFTKFLANHMSTASFVEIMSAMTDPDSDITFQGLVTLMSTL